MPRASALGWRLCRGYDAGRALLPAGTEGALLRHRYVVDPAEAARMRAAAWIEEGTVFCAPP